MFHAVCFIYMYRTEIKNKAQRTSGFQSIGLALVFCLKAPALEIIQSGAGF